MITKERVFHWHVKLEGPDALAIAEAGIALGWGPGSGEIEIDNSKKATDLSKAWAAAESKVVLKHQWTMTVLERAMRDAKPIATLVNQNVELDLEALPQQLASIPFEVAAFGSIADWPDDYRTPSWPGGFSIGWAVAFRGEGHKRLPSRNWCTRGPWKTWSGPGDVTVVQFHELNADPQTAVEQARPGHQRFGVDATTGGYLQDRYVYAHELRGVYVKDTETIRVIVHGREVSNSELRDWAAARREGKYKHVAFVFMMPDEARAYLPRLWRYGHEVWAMFDGEERRIDEGYVPPDETPAWAKS